MHSLKPALVARISHGKTSDSILFRIVPRKNTVAVFYGIECALPGIDRKHRYRAFRPGVYSSSSWSRPPPGGDIQPPRWLVKHRELVRADRGRKWGAVIAVYTRSPGAKFERPADTWTRVRRSSLTAEARVCARQEEFFRRASRRD